MQLTFYFYQTALLYCYHLVMSVSLELHKPQSLTVGYSSNQHLSLSAFLLVIFTMP